MKPGFQGVVLVPLFPQFLTHVSESKTPGQRSGECINNESLQVHPGHPCRKSYKGANGGQKTADEYNNFTMACEPTISHVDIVTRD
jgi:hypothetical protein